MSVFFLAVATVSPLCVAVASSLCATVVSPLCAATTPLSQVVEEAKHPAEDQYVVSRDAAPAQAPTPTGADDDSESGGVLDLIGSFFSFLGSLFSQDGEASLTASCESPPTTAEITPVDGEWQQLPSPEEPRFQAGIRSLFVRPHDGVLNGLDGGGVEIGIRACSRIGLEGGIYWLRGQLRPSSHAHGGLEDLQELALDLRARVPLWEGRTTEFAAFTGVRFGQLQWEYANSVFAIDSGGAGAEIWNDSLQDVSGYFGLGLVPFRTRSFRLGVDFGLGWRRYSNQTYEGFANDLFTDAWMTQLAIEVRFAF